MNFVVKLMNFELKVMDCVLNMQEDVPPWEMKHALAVPKHFGADLQVSHLLIYQSPACSTDLLTSNCSSHWPAGPSRSCGYQSLT